MGKKKKRRRKEQRAALRERRPPSTAVEGAEESAERGTARSERFERYSPHLFTALLLLGLILRILHLSAISSDPIFLSPILDAKNYEEWGFRLSKGEGWPEGAFSSNPLYPLIVSLVYRLFGRNLHIIRFIQALSGIFTSFLLMKVSGRLFGRGAGIAALFLTLFSSSLLFYEGELLGETWVILFVMISLYLFLFRKDWACLLFSGIFLGLAALGRPNLLLFCPVPAILAGIRGFKGEMVVDKKGMGGGRRNIPARGFRFLPALIFLAGLSISILPVTARNIKEGDFVLITAHGGVNLFIGNNPKADGWFRTPKGSGLEGGQLSLLESSKRVAERSKKRRLKPSDVSDYWTGRALDFIKDQPGKALSLLFKKAFYFWNAYEKPMVANLYYTKGISPVLKYLTIPFGIIAPLFFAGLFILFKERVIRKEGAILLLLYVLASFLSVIIFFVSARYRLPSLAGIIPIAGLGMIRILSGMWRREWRSLRDLLIPLAIASLLIHIPSGGRVDDLGHHYYLLGNVLSDRKDYKGAVEAFQNALSLKGDDEMFLNNLGIALKNSGRNEEAVEVLKRAIEINPKHKKAYLNLGVALKRLKRYEEAEKAYRDALELDPKYKLALHNLGNLYFVQGRLDDAENYFQKVLDIDPRFTKSLVKMKEIRKRRGD